MQGLPQVVTSKKEAAAAEDGQPWGSQEVVTQPAWTLLRPGVPNNLASGQPSVHLPLGARSLPCAWTASPAVGLAWVTLGCWEPLPRVTPCGTLTAGREGVQTGRLCGPLLRPVPGAETRLARTPSHP